MKYLLFISFTLISVAATAQLCEDEDLVKIPGKWRQGQQGSMIGVSATDLAREKANLVALQKMIATKHSPRGADFSFSYVFGKYVREGQKFYGDPYQLAIYILPFWCEKDRSKWYVDVASPTNVHVTINAIYLIDLMAANLEPDELRGYLKLKQRPVKKDGAWLIQDEVVGDSHLKSKIKQHTWLITYNDTLPFMFVNRKEYLLLEKKNLEKYNRNSPSDVKYNEQFLKNIERELQQSEEYLSQPAICMWNQEFRFEKFVPEGTLGSFFAVKPNLAYYRNKLPLSSPQFITVTYKFAEDLPQFEENIAGIKKALDITALRNMLGK